MALIKTQALVIKEIGVGEADKIITLFTPKNGKIQASAQGARRPKSRLIAACQFLCYGDFVLYKGKEIYRVSQAEVVESFYNIRNSIEKLSYATYFVELTSEVIEENYGGSQLLKLLLNTLHMLSVSDKKPKLLKIIFELRLMSIIGYAPNLVACTNCGSPESKMYFNSTVGGLICLKCMAGMKSRNNFTISEGALYAMRFILYSEMNKIFSFEVSEKVQEELDAITQDFILTHIGKEFRSLKFLKNMANAGELYPFI
ncbi:DNA repair protein RecO [Petroclostridium sp. X23]|uniref:DNA repair protein RecO n=1 Tax=Petroclostridium sp. X23 TaxID=3045146 RepID=UPI0024ACA133|nr:DNA repair protein RecO [Petroclostridium sp. X23]WHH59572.1 DNA repair protein RecO [Petroclostridium sp. X23]